MPTVFLHTTARRRISRKILVCGLSYADAVTQGLFSFFRDEKETSCAVKTQSRSFTGPSSLKAITAVMEPKIRSLCGILWAGSAPSLLFYCCPWPILSDEVVSCQKSRISQSFYIGSDTKCVKEAVMQTLMPFGNIHLSPALDAADA